MSQRQAIIQLNCAGKINSQNVKLLKTAKSIVRDAVMRYKELETWVIGPDVDAPELLAHNPKLKPLGSE